MKSSWHYAALSLAGSLVIHAEPRAFAYMMWMYGPECAAGRDEQNVGLALRAALERHADDDYRAAVVEAAGELQRERDAAQDAVTA